MKLLISGHRKQKLTSYDTNFIKNEIDNILTHLVENHITIIGLSGMADGVDLWFCESCRILKIPYYPCIPFESQDEYMSEDDKQLRKELIRQAKTVYHYRNSKMVEMCDGGIVVWDGNKGGTHNVFQQMVEYAKPFYWINPVIKKSIYVSGKE